MGIWIDEFQIFSPFPYMAELWYMCECNFYGLLLVKCHIEFGFYSWNVLKWRNMRGLLFTCLKHWLKLLTKSKLKLKRVRLNQYVDFHVLREWGTICCEWSYMSSWAFAIFLEPWFFDSWFLILFIVMIWQKGGYKLLLISSLMAELIFK